MVSPRVMNEPPHSIAPFLTQKPSAHHQTLADTRRPKAERAEAEAENFSRYAANAKPAEDYFEARHNGTDGNVVILPFSAAAHNESRNSAGRHNSKEVSIPI